MKLEDLLNRFLELLPDLTSIREYEVEILGVIIVIVFVALAVIMILKRRAPKWG